MQAIRPMPPRDPQQEHRAATPLELLFDLVSVIAIAVAAAGLHHAVAEAHAVEGILKFVAPYRLLTMVIMFGALIMAAGIEPFFDHLDLRVIVTGYVVMRLGMVALWLRAAANDAGRRPTAMRYAIGIALVQCFWVAFGWLPEPGTGLFYGLFAVGAVLELAVPAIAERGNATPWHRHHIMERYGLLNIIVLGETLLAGSMALNHAVTGHFDIALVHIALSAMLILFSMWWLYFARQEHLQDQRLSRALTWGYGHFLIYMSGAAVGAGFAVLVDVITGHAKIGLLAGDYAVAIPVAGYLAGLWFVRDRFVLGGVARHSLLLFAALVLLVPPLLALEGVALVAVVAVWVRGRVAPRRMPGD